MRPVIVGMNNPLSSDPRHALWPHPPGCTGHRLWQMLNDRCGAFQNDYTEAFDRRNVLSARQWSAQAARRGAQELAPRLAGRDVVLLGSDTIKAFALPPVPPLAWQTGGGAWARWIRVPHPSGRNLWFNDEVHRLATGLLLEELLALHGAAGKKGV